MVTRQPEAGGEVGTVAVPSVPPPSRSMVAGVAAVGAALAVPVLGHAGAGWALARVVVVGTLAGLAVLAVARWPRRWAAVLALAVGLVGVAAGVGLAGPHVVKQGWSVASAVGVVLLAGGLVAVVSGTAGLVGGARGRRRLLVVAAVVPAVVVVGLVATFVLGQAVAATNVPPTPIGSATPAGVGLAYEDVELRTADGVRLAAWYVPSRNGAAVVLRHGAGSNRSDALPHAAVLAGLGFGVLLTDARGHGASGGEAMDFGWWGDLDVAAAVDFLAGRPDVEGGRIGAVGLSMGGEEVLGALGAEPRLRAVVAEGATRRVAADAAWLSDAFGVRGWLQEGLEALTFGVADLLTAASPPPSLRSAVAKAAPRPVLLITAGEVPDEARAAAFIRSGSPGSVEVWEVAGAGHTGGLAAAPEAWASRVASFLTRALARPSPGESP